MKTNKVNKETCLRYIKWVGTNKIDGLFYWITSIDKYRLVFDENCFPIAVKSKNEMVTYELAYLENQEEIEEKVIKEAKRTGYFLMAIFYFFAIFLSFQDARGYLPDKMEFAKHFLIYLALLVFSGGYLYFQENYKGEYERFIVVGKYLLMGLLALTGLFSSHVLAIVAVLMIFVFIIYDEQIHPLDEIAQSGHFFRVETDGGRYYLIILFNQEEG